MIKKQLSYLISPEDAGQTVEQFLRKKGYSHRLVVHLRNTPLGLSIGKETAYTSHMLKPGEILFVTLKEEENSEHIIPTRLPLSIAYEDEDILVVNKAPGMPIHPSQGHFENTLANAVAWYYQSLGESFVYRAINRLDRDTSGLLIHRQAYAQRLCSLRSDGKTSDSPGIQGHCLRPDTGIRFNRPAHWTRPRLYGSAQNRLGGRRGSQNPFLAALL